MSKHTPGPWSFDLETLDQDLENHISIDAPKHGSLASVVWVMEEASAHKRIGNRAWRLEIEE